MHLPPFSRAWMFRFPNPAINFIITLYNVREHVPKLILECPSILKSSRLTIRHDLPLDVNLFLINDIILYNMIFLNPVQK